MDAIYICSCSFQWPWPWYKVSDSGSAKAKIQFLIILSTKQGTSIKVATTGFFSLVTLTLQTIIWLDHLVVLNKKKRGQKMYSDMTYWPALPHKSESGHHRSKCPLSGQPLFLPAHGPPFQSPWKCLLPGWQQCTHIYIGVFFTFSALSIPYRRVQSLCLKKPTSAAWVCHLLLPQQ